MARVKRLDLTRAVMLWEMRFPPGEITPPEESMVHAVLAVSDGLPRKFAAELEDASVRLKDYADFVRAIEVR